MKMLRHSKLSKYLTYGTVYVMRQIWYQYDLNLDSGSDLTSVIYSYKLISPWKSNNEHDVTHIYTDNTNTQRKVNFCSVHLAIYI